MSYPLHTLQQPELAAAHEPLGLGRFMREFGLLLTFLLLLGWFFVLLSYSSLDPAWSTTGVGVAEHTRNWGGRVGAWIADLSYFWLGFSVWWMFAACVWRWLASLAKAVRAAADPPGSSALSLPVKRSGYVFLAGLALLLCASCALEWSRLYRFETVLPGDAGGALGHWMGPFFVKWFGFNGAGVVCIALGVLGAAAVFRFSWSQVAERIGQWLDALMLRYRARREQAQDVALGVQAVREREQTAPEELRLAARPARLTKEALSEAEPDNPVFGDARAEVDAEEPESSTASTAEPLVFSALEAGFVRVDDPNESQKSGAPAKPTAKLRPADQRPLAFVDADGAASRLPSVDLLDAAPPQQVSVSDETLEMTSRLIEKKLKDFGVQVSVLMASPGPVITRYEIEPATGVKGSQIVGLAKDLARSLSLVSIRVIETIPGKNCMALELPNARRQTIRLSEILGSKVYTDASSLLTMGLGKDIIGDPVVADLGRMPHLLVAGTTGSGKSVGINAMILSLLYKADPRDVRLLMIDPKMLEMSVYEGIPHLLAPVVTDMRQAAHGLNWCVGEMDKRYRLLSKMGVRNLAGYNAKIDAAKAAGEFIYNPFSLTPESPEPLDRLPHIVVLIDELADLMMVVGKKIEELIARLAQKARAAGIHLILATQRPSVDVITGLIKANVPTRIAFQVSSKIDSRTILDQMGAEALLGMGDMLYMASGTGLPVRVHGAFVSDEEVHRVVKYLKSQGEPDYIEGLLEGGTADGDGELGLDGEAGGEKDPMYDQAVEVVLKNRKASISLVQRHLKIGYNRAARLVEDMEKAGLVSAMSNSGQREILVPARAE
ncbi:MAG: DNA translocase FtsK 4TM domain-containing protein, partial [Burkholderiaceae bacterium]